MVNVLYILLLIALPLLPVLSICALWAWLRARRERVRIVVHTLAAIVGQNLPLTAALRAAAMQERGALRRIFRSMGLVIEQGHTLATALRLAFPGCPGHVVGAVDGAERGGTLGSVLRSLSADLRRGRGQPGVGGTLIPYCVMMLIVAPTVVLFFCVRVMPKYKEIFRDFGTPLPPITVWLLNATRWPAESPWAVMLVFAVLLTALYHWFFARNFLVRAPQRVQWSLRLWDALVWHVPLARNVASTRALARQLPLVLAGLRAGADLPEALRQAACVGVNHHARVRLRRWASAIERGAEPIQAARLARVPHPVRAALAGADDSLAMRLEYLALYYRGLWTHWDQVAASILAPLVVMVWALCVGFIALALFLPLIALIRAVCETIV